MLHCSIFVASPIFAKGMSLMAEDQWTPQQLLAIAALAAGSVAVAAARAAGYGWVVIFSSPKGESRYQSSRQIPTHCQFSMVSF